MSLTREQRQEIRVEKAKDRANVKALVGRRIVKAEPRACWEDDGANGCWMHSWRLTLDNGAVVVFSTEEHPIGVEYGTDLTVINKETKHGAVPEQADQADHALGEGDRTRR